MSRRLRLILLSLLVALVPLLLQGRTAAAATWSNPVNISNSPAYDNVASIAASPNGAVTAVWARTQSGVGNLMMYARANSPAGPFRVGQIGPVLPEKSSGSPVVRADSLGRSHVVWWQYEGSTVCDYYARIEADGRVSVNERVPGTCGHSYKNTALAVGPGNSAHMLFGQNLQSLYYWVRADSGWTIQAEKLPVPPSPEAPTLGVTTNGTVIAAWKGKAEGQFGDIYAGVRQGPGDWRVENLSSSLTPGCPGESKTDEPHLAADPSGGMRIVWLDERCDPRNEDPTMRDPYYREWNPQAGWGATPPVRLGRSPGNAFDIAVVVDGAGVSHVIWVDTKKFFVTMFYTTGRGTSFSTPVNLFQNWIKGEETKDMALAYSPGYLHMVFGSTHDDPQKENYYTYLPLPMPAPPPPTPTPAPPSERVPGTGSRTFPETGQTVTGIFLDYWNNHGGLLQQGFPISGVMRETSPLNSKSYLVQYFERAVFEYHPENQPPYNVLLSQLGTFRYKQKYPNGAPGQRVNQDAGAFFPQTGHKVGGSFWQYWQQHGGLEQQGYPISDELTEVSDIDGKTYTVQYFERSVFEWHPEYAPPYNVLLQLLGVFQLKQKGGR